MPYVSNFRSSFIKEEQINTHNIHQDTKYEKGQRQQIQTVQ